MTIYKTVKRTWRERLFSLPWRPFRATEQVRDWAAEINRQQASSVKPWTSGPRPAPTVRAAPRKPAAARIPPRAEPTTGTSTFGESETYWPRSYAPPDATPDAPSFHSGGGGHFGGGGASGGWGGDSSSSSSSSSDSGSSSPSSDGSSSSGSD